MKRFIYPMLWSGCRLTPPFVIVCLREQDPRRIDHQRALERKVSKDILKKVEDGRGADFVRVIIQPANQSDPSIDSTLEDSGGSNIRKFKNFAVRVVTLPVQAAVNIASSKRCFICLSEPRRQAHGPCFAHHRSRSDPEQWRSNNNGSLDGTGIGIAVLDSGIDAAAPFFSKQIKRRSRRLQ